jgi:antitoxin (DNA-binding transcriptional repressor) of toxin-antitoxin stability system
MSKIVNMHEAKTHLSRLADEVRESGEPLIIAKAGSPWVQLTLIAPKKPVFGAGAKKYAGINTDDLDSLNDEIAKMFLNKELG